MAGTGSAGRTGRGGSPDGEAVRLGAPARVPSTVRARGRSCLARTGRRGTLR